MTTTTDWLLFIVIWILGFILYTLIRNIVNAANVEVMKQQVKIFGLTKDLRESNDQYERLVGQYNEYRDNHPSDHDEEDEDEDEDDEEVRGNAFDGTDFSDN